MALEPAREARHTSRDDSSRARRATAATPRAAPLPHYSAAAAASVYCESPPPPRPPRPPLAPPRIPSPRRGSASVTSVTTARRLRRLRRLQLRVGHVGVGVLDLVEHELGLVLEEELRRALHIDKEGVHPLDVLHLDLDALPLGADEGGGDDQLDRVAQRGLDADLGEQRECVLGHLD